jgi:hypothetical protein
MLRLIAALALTAPVLPHIPAQTIKVVNMVPLSRSGEVFQDSEPSLAVNPANTAQIAATSITNDLQFSTVGKGPIYISNSAGLSWAIATIVPGAIGSALPYYDATLSFGANNTLYAAILKSGGPGRPTPLSVLKAANFPTLTVMTQMAGSSRNDIDQPQIQALTITVSTVKKDLIFVANDDYDIDPNPDFTHTAAVDQFNQTAFVPTMIESRDTWDRDGAPVRAAVHANQTVYGAFLARRSMNTTVSPAVFMADLVLVCDQTQGTGVRTFSALKDTDGKIGKKLMIGLRLPVTKSIGQERLGADLAIAIVPSNSNIVYVAWSDLVNGIYTLHLRRFTNGTSPTFSSLDLVTIQNAKNPALAVNTDGTVLFLYQQLTGTAPNQFWETRFERSTNGFATPVTPTVLSKWKLPVPGPGMVYLPFLGDYAQVTAVGRNFYGVFCASNFPDKANFPQGVTYFRKVQWDTHILTDTAGKTVAASLDPFFFKVTIP